jgi:hypothetical protein
MMFYLGEPHARKTINCFRRNMLKGHIEKHRINVEIYLTNSVGIGEHSDIIETIEKELDEIAKYQDHLELIKKYFR